MRLEGCFQFPHIIPHQSRFPAQSFDFSLLRLTYSKYQGPAMGLLLTQRSPPVNRLFLGGEFVKRDAKRRRELLRLKQEGFLAAGFKITKRFFRKVIAYRKHRQ